MSEPTAFGAPDPAGDDLLVEPVTTPGPAPSDGAVARRRDDRGPRGRRHSVKETLTAIALLIPSALIFVMFFFYPLIRLVDMGLHRRGTFGRGEKYIGWSQYSDVLTGKDFLDGLRITALFVLYTVPLGLVLGTLLAVAVNRRLRGVKIFQTIFSSTVASSVAVTSVVFLVLLNPQVGYFKDISFFNLADPDTALRGVAISSVWQNLGLSFIIVLAGLQAIPDEIYEAADLDGYGAIRRFFRVTVPLISPTLMFLAVVLVIFGFQAFAQVDILTNGGPQRSTETLVFKIFSSQQPVDQGKGAVMAIGLFLVTMFVTLGQFLILDRRVHYGD